MAGLYIDGEDTVKIKRKDYERMQAELVTYERMAQARIIIGSADGDLYNMTFEQAETAARFTGHKGEDWIGGVIAFKVVPVEYASGYDMFLVNKYAQPDDSPWNVFSRYRITDEPLDTPAPPD